MFERPTNVGVLAREFARQERIRDGYLELAAEGITPREELRGKLRTVDAELERLRAALNAPASYRQDAEELEANLQKRARRSSTPQPSDSTAWRSRPGRDVPTPQAARGDRRRGEHGPERRVRGCVPFVFRKTFIPVRPTQLRISQ